MPVDSGRPSRVATHDQLLLEVTPRSTNLVCVLGSHGGLICNLISLDVHLQIVEFKISQTPTATRFKSVTTSVTPTGRSLNEKKTSTIGAPSNI